MDNPERVTYFAATDSRGKRVPFGIKKKDRVRHMYVIGKTGMGKSTLLENMAIQDIRNGEGLAFIDPHGGTVDKLLDYVPENRINDVVYFAPFDLDNPIAFNVMEDVGYDKRHLVVSGLMAAFKKIWVDAWSARMEYILSNTLLALLEYPDATLLSVNRMYVDKGFRKKVVDNVKDPVVKDFWTKEFATYTDRYTQEATPAIQNKIGQFTSNPLIRNIIGQPKSSFDIRTLMDEKKILIMNLSKGLVGETNMRLLGSMLTTRIFLAAMSRADASAATLDRLPHCYFFVDEFQNFANETFAEILSEARKYKLNLIIAHQYIEQMEEEVRAAVFGNVGTTVAFRVGPFDAEVLETVFSPEFMKEDLVNLGFAQVYLSLMIDGIGSRPFSALTIPPIEPPPRSYRTQVIEASRKNFAAPRTQIEESIVTELTSAPIEDMPAPKPSWKGKNSTPAPRTEPRQESRLPREPRKEVLRPEGPKDLKEALTKAAHETKPKSPDSPSLKDTLARLLEEKGGPIPSLQEAPASVPPQPVLPKVEERRETPMPSAEAKKPFTPPQPSIEQTTPRPQESPRPEAHPEAKRVFEVPESELRALFNDDHQ